jgi:FkbM family methyltransferase
VIDVPGGAGFNRCKPCRHGTMVYNVNDRHIGRSLDLYGEWAEAELELLGLFIKPGDVVVDAGANVGTHALFFARKVGPGGRVFAFEPQRIAFQSLCASLALNSITQVQAFHAALSRQPGTLFVPLPDHQLAANYGGLSLAPGAGARPGEELEPVAVMTLDQLPPDQLARHRCRLIKIDVEGMELEVIDGARALIEAARPILYVENNDLSRSPALIGRLLELGYRLFWHVSRFYNPKNYFDNPENVFGDVGDINMIAVVPQLASAFGAFPPVTGPDDNWLALQQRLASAAPTAGRGPLSG